MGSSNQHRPGRGVSWSRLRWRVTSPRAAAAFSPARHQQLAAAGLPGTEPAGPPRDRRRAAAAAAVAVQQAATAEGAAEDEDDGAPVARSRGGRVLKRSAAAQVTGLLPSWLGADYDMSLAGCSSAAAGPPPPPHTRDLSQQCTASGQTRHSMCPLDRLPWNTRFDWPA